MANDPRGALWGPDHLLGAVRRQIRIVLSCLGVALALAVAAVAVIPSSYTSAAGVLVKPLINNPYAPDGAGSALLNLETEAQLVNTDAVASIVQAELKSTEPLETLLSPVQVDVTSNTQIVTITYTSPDPGVARARAQAFADGYLAYRVKQARSQLDAAGKRLQDQIKTTTAQLDSASENAGEGSADERELASERVRSLTSEVVRLQSDLAENKATPLVPGEVITPAALPTSPTLPPIIIIATVLLLGAAAAVGLALWRDLRDPRIRSEQDAERFGVTVLGELGERTGWSARDLDQILEAHRLLRSSFLSVLPASPVIVFVGLAELSDRAPDVVAPLAVALSRSEVSVVVVDAAVDDWLEQELSPQSEVGLADVLGGSTESTEAVTALDANLAVLPRGRWTSAATEHLGSTRMRRALQTLAASYDVVLVSCPNIHSADGQTLLRMADAALIEGTIGTLTRTDLIEAVNRITQAGVLPLGLVVATSEPRRRRAAGTRAPNRTNSRPRPSPSQETPARRSSPPPPKPRARPASARPASDRRGPAVATAHNGKASVFEPPATAEATHDATPEPPDRSAPEALPAGTARAANTDVVPAGPRALDPSGLTRGGRRKAATPSRPTRQRLGGPQGTPRGGATVAGGATVSISPVPAEPDEDDEAGGVDDIDAEIAADLPDAEVDDDAADRSEDGEVESTAVKRDEPVTEDTESFVGLLRARETPPQT